jgi:hypothetical protein
MDTSAARDGSFTTLLGAELSSTDWDDEDVFWVNAIGLARDFRAPSPGEPHAAIIRRAAEAGASNVALHPGLTSFLDFDGLRVHDLDAVETYNVNAAQAWPEAEGRYAVDALLGRVHRPHVTVGDDAHRHHERDRFRAWVEVRVERLGPDALLHAHLAALSGALIALAFVGQMSRLGAAFYAFALILLPVLASPRHVRAARP